MALSEEMTSALNHQLQLELESAYLYLGMSFWLQSNKLPGFAGWMKAQANEELRHGMRISDYMAEQDSPVCLGNIEAPTSDWNGARDCVDEALTHEKLVTKSIHELVEKAEATKDHATVSMLQWFIDEQVEEESSLKEILDRLSVAGSDGTGLLLIDSQLGERKRQSAAA